MKNHFTALQTLSFDQMRDQEPDALFAVIKIQSKLDKRRADERRQPVPSIADAIKMVRNTWKFRVTEVGLLAEDLYTFYSYGAARYWCPNMKCWNL